ncbi:hypothetical protein [Marinospirillum sp.]|uniref:hypothetical protein n=1 Tax=Marinospirillum sp. TaxID=2183934 RepID=UPI00286FD7C7|nr:hypothetical protein [Marinospirillum sp.]MDR9468490.1 hypothetical protein [Marinospirillum sp.]
MKAKNRTLSMAALVVGLLFLAPASLMAATEDKRSAAPCAGKMERGERMQAYREKRESIQYSEEEVHKMAEAAALRHLGSGATARVESLDSGYQVTLIQADGEEVRSYPLNAAGWPERDGKRWGHYQR